MNSTTPLPSPLPELLALFEDELEEVRFPDVDHAILEEAGQAWRDAHAEVEERQRALDEARAELQARRAQMEQLARRAIDYARIFASEAPELLARIEEVAAAVSPSRARKTRKTRKSRKKEPDTEAAQLALAKEDDAREDAA